MGNALSLELKDIENGGPAPLHLFRYFCARGFVTPEDTVLDIGCGTGYGSDILSKVAKQVDAYDIEPGNLHKIEEKYPQKNIIWHCVDVEKEPLPDADVAVQFENLEHLYNPKAFVDKLKPKIRKYIIMSVPIGERLVNVNGNIQASVDATHHSAFASVEDVLRLYVDDTWRVFYFWRDSLTYIIALYNHGIF